MIKNIPILIENKRRKSKDQELKKESEKTNFVIPSCLIAIFGEQIKSKIEILGPSFFGFITSAVCKWLTGIYLEAWSSSYRLSF